MQDFSYALFGTMCVVFVQYTYVLVNLVQVFYVLVVCIALAFYVVGYII